MTVQLGQTAPDFEQDSSHGRLRFHEWLGDEWAVLFSHRLNCTPDCVAELGQAAALMPEFDRRGVKLIALMAGARDAHHSRQANDAGDAVAFPMIADADRSVGMLYGMAHPEADHTVSVRTIIIIDPAKTVRLMLIYPPRTGRSFREILRVIDSLQHAPASSGSAAHQPPDEPAHLAA